MSRKTKKQTQGQVMILVAMLSTTFIFFFKFVVDTGILVVAKINLQNAADMAAYSGAAAQARLLNQIGFLNYDMRKAYKRFLFRYYGLGTFSQDSYPKTAGGSGTREYTPGDGTSNSPKGPNYNVPVVCIDYQNSTYPQGQVNYCRLTQLTSPPEINGIPAGSGTGKIYNQFIKNLGKTQANNGCTLFTANNMSTLMAWLYNADPENKQLDAEIQKLQSAPSNPAVTQQLLILDKIKQLTQGMGLVPRLLINKMRIDTLTDYLNERANESGVTIDGMSQFESSPDPAQYERIIEAFYSAYHTLGPFLFDSSTITLREISPSGTTPYAAFKVIPFSFSSYFLAATEGGNNDCKFVPTLMATENIPLGVYKDTSIMTYYAIRLEAEAKLLYWPNQKFKIKAYSTAKPFGGFIGPNEDDYRTKLGLGGLIGGVSSGSTKCPSVDYDAIGYDNLNGTRPLRTCNPSGYPLLPPPNTKLTGLADSLGFDDKQFQYEIAQKISVTNSGRTLISFQKLPGALQFAEMPNPAEKSLFLIPNDAGDVDPYTSGTQSHLHENGGDPFNHYFHNTPTPLGSRYVHYFWAPIFSPTNPFGLQGAIQDMMDGLEKITNTTNPLPPVALARVTLVKQLIKDSITDYMQVRLYNNGVDTNRGELGESTYVGATEDVLNPTEISGFVPGTSPPASPTYHMVDANSLRTSWVTTKDENMERERRVGYSVKFIRFKDVSGKTATGSLESPDGKGATITNKLRIDSEMQLDRAFDNLDH